MVEFLRKLENRAIKSGRDNSVLITKIYQFTVIYFNSLGPTADCATTKPFIIDLDGAAVTVIPVTSWEPVEPLEKKKVCVIMV